MSDIYARRALGRLKVGHTPCLPVSASASASGTRDPYLRDVFWHRPGDQVTESYVQARLHILGIWPVAPFAHNTRMTEWFDVPDEVTDLDITDILDSIYAEACVLDKRGQEAIFA